MKITVFSKFHNKEAQVSIKSTITAPRGTDILSALDYAVYADTSDAHYARRKFAEIKDKLCGQKDCKCCFFVR